MEVYSKPESVLNNEKMVLNCCLECRGPRPNIILRPCGHTFHPRCIFVWPLLACPVCRAQCDIHLMQLTEYLPTDVKYPREVLKELRTGRWPAEEEAYLLQLVQLINTGLLPMCNNAKVNGFLSSLLVCNIARLGSKIKLPKKYVKKHPPASLSVLHEYQEAQRRLSELEESFISSSFPSSDNRTIHINTLCYHIQMTWVSHFTHWAAEIGQTYHASLRVLPDYLNCPEFHEVHTLPLTPPLNPVTTMKQWLSAALPQPQQEDNSLTPDAFEQTIRDLFHECDLDIEYDEETSTLCCKRTRPPTAESDGEMDLPPSKYWKEHLDDLRTRAPLHSPGPDAREIELSKGSPVLVEFLRELYDGTALEVMDMWIPCQRDGNCVLVFGGSAGLYNDLMHWGNYSKQFIFHDSIGVPGRVFSSAMPEMNEDITSLSEESFLRKSIAMHLKIRMYIAVPYIVKNKVAAVLAFYSTSRDGRPAEKLDRLYEILSQYRFVINPPEMVA